MFLLADSYCRLGYSTYTRGVTFQSFADERKHRKYYAGYLEARHRIGYSKIGVKMRVSGRVRGVIRLGRG